MGIAKGEPQRINIVKRLKDGLPIYNCFISPDKPRFQTEYHDQFAAVINWLYKIGDNPEIPDEIFIKRIIEGRDLSRLEYSAIYNTKEAIGKIRGLERERKELK